MEGLECKVVSSWPFDPLPSDVLLLPHARSTLKSILSSDINISDTFYDPNTTNKYPNTNSLNFPLTLTSFSPMPLSPLQVLQMNDDVNNNSNSMVGVSFLTLDPLVAGDSVPNQSLDHLQKFSSISEQNSGNSEISHGSEQIQQIQNVDTIQPVQNFDLSLTLNPRNADDDGMYFSIHDLDQFQERNVDGDMELMEELGDCAPELGQNLDHSDSTLESNFLSDDLGKELKKFRLESIGTNTSFEIEVEQNSNPMGVDSVGVGVEIDDLDDVEVDMEPQLELELGMESEGVEIEETDGIDGKQELKCKFCGFVCCSKSSLGIHERRHTGERPYACKHCGRLFNSAQCCKHHERLHTGDKPFECQYCGKKYAVSTRLKRHERVHTREEPYKCGEPGCGKTFRWFDAFRDHRNTHNGVPLYLCSVCGKSFTSYLKFYYHERGHFLKRERDRDRKPKVPKGQDQKGQKPNSTSTKAKGPKVKTTTTPRKPGGGGGRSRAKKAVP